MRTCKPTTLSGSEAIVTYRIKIGNTLNIGHEQKNNLDIDLGGIIYFSSLCWLHLTTKYHIRFFDRNNHNENYYK